MSATETEKVAKSEEEVTYHPGWVVVVYNDDYHTFDYVIDCFCEIASLTPKEAFDKALEIHNNGQTNVVGPMSKMEAQEICLKIKSFGPDPYSKKPELNLGLKADVKEA